MAGERTGQSFEARQTGEVTSITFRTGGGAVAGTYNLRIGPIADPPTVVVAGAVYQTFTIAAGAQIFTINLNTPFPVTIGMSYAFGFETTSTNNPPPVASATDYADGAAYRDEGGGLSTFAQGFDFDFAVQISPASAPPDPNIPTLGQWGLIALTLLLLTFGVVAIRVRRMQRA